MIGSSVAFTVEESFILLFFLFSGLTAPVLTNTLVSVVVRLHIQETAKTSLTTEPQNQENTIFLIQPINVFLFTVTCSQNLALYGH